MMEQQHTIQPTEPEKYARPETESTETELSHEWLAQVAGGSDPEFSSRFFNGVASRIGQG
jgi:hypothetical protein